MRFMSVLATTVCCALAAVTANAGTIFSQPGGLGGGAASTFYFSDTSTYPPLIGNNQQMADNFSISSAASVTSLRWWGTSWSDISEYGGAFDNVLSFAVTIYSASGGLPGAVVHSTTILTENVTANSDVPAGFDGGYRYEATLDSAWYLAAGNYFFSVVAQLDDPESSVRWGWQNLLNGDGAVFRSQGTSDVWTAFAGQNLAFALLGEPVVIPLPPAAWIGLAGLAGVAALRRRSA